MTLESEQQPNTKKGVFISFEGGEGAGKSTHMSFLAETLENRNYEVVCLREPGSTTVGEKMRSIVLDAKNDMLDIKTELLIYEAARAQMVAEVIKPALKRGAVVLCDRFFDSTIAYQVYGRGLDGDFVHLANEFAVDGVYPDRTILLTHGQDAQVGLDRATEHVSADRIEQAGAQFHTKVNEGFLLLAKASPDRIRIVVSADEKSQTSKQIFAQLEDVFPWMADKTLINDSFFSKLDTVYYGNKRRPLDSSQEENLLSARGD